MTKFMQIDYSPTERLALIVDILAEGVIALSAVMNLLEAFDRLKVKEFVKIEIMRSDL
ncbi:MAG: hypothetical protein HYZ85_02845 [Candidatus Omnitrophica bacterium]|nr:hypothetical protein [Candidatus Omnitrophota bacterium]